MMNHEMSHTNGGRVVAFGPQPAGGAPLLPPLPSPASCGHRRSLIAMGMMAVALFVAASVLGVLAWTTSQDYGAAADRLAERQQERGRAEDRVVSTDRDRKDAQQKVNGLEVANARETDCAEAAQAALTSRGRAATSNSVEQLRDRCR